MKHKPFFFILLYLFSLVPCVSFGSEASLFADVMHDFAPLPAEILKVDAGVVTVNQGLQAGLAEGDLFQVYRKGAPVSAGRGAGVIGYLKEPFALLRVDHVRKGTAGCTVINARGSIAAGMQAMRFSDMTAVLVITSGTGKNETLCRRFSDMLPALKWLDSTDLAGPVEDAEGMAASGIDLLFLLSTSRLVVYGPGHVRIRSYLLSGGPLHADHDKTSMSALASSRPSGTSGISQNNSGAFRWDDSKLPASAADIQGWKVAGRLASVATQVDIVDMDGDGRSETVYLVPRALYIFPYRTHGQLLSWEVSGPGRAVGFYTSGTDGWIVVNVLMEGTGLRSVLLRYGHDSLVIVQDEINLWLSFHDLDGNGLRNTLLGQVFDLRAIWGDRIYILNASLQGIEYLQEISLPPDFRTGWGEWGDIDGNGHQELCIIDRSGRIWLYEDSMLRWSSASIFASAGDMMMPFLAADIYNDGSLDMLFAGSVMEHGETTADIICCLRWNKGRFQARPLIRPADVGIVGLSVEDGALLAAAVKNVMEDDKNGETVLYQQLLPLPSP